MSPNIREIGSIGIVGGVVAGGIVGTFAALEGLGPVGVGMAGSR